jgi:hypothetical protein
LPACHRIIGFSCSLELGFVDVFVVGLKAFEIEFICVIDAVDDVDPLRLVQVNADDWGSAEIEGQIAHGVAPSKCESEIAKPSAAIDGDRWVA